MAKYSPDGKKSRGSYDESSAANQNMPLFANTKYPLLLSSQHCRKSKGFLDFVWAMSGYIGLNEPSLLLHIVRDDKIRTEPSDN